VPPQSIFRLRQRGVSTSPTRAYLAGDDAVAAHDAPVRARLEQLRHRAAGGIGMRAAAREIASDRQVDRAWDFALQRRNYRIIDAPMARIGKQMRR
jgi:hypothetical protein